MDPFTLTILIIFVTTIVATIIQRRTSDPCLKRFHNYHAHLRLKSGKWIWGHLQVYPKSLELVYNAPHLDTEGHQELSFLLFEDTLPDIQIIYRPKPNPGTVPLNLWNKEMKKLMGRSIWRTFRRSWRNIYNTLRDACSQSIGVVVGQLRAKNPAALLGGADATLTSTGQKLVTYGNNSYEPILEKYLGHDVVLEILVNEKWIEQIGLLEEYSDKYILVRNALPHPELPLGNPESREKRIDLIVPRTMAVVRHRAIRMIQET